MTVTADHLRARRAQIRVQMDDLTRTIASLETEAYELEVAERVIVRLGHPAPSQPSEMPRLTIEPSSRLRLSEMVMIAVREMEPPANQVGLLSRDLYGYIAQRWQPDVTASSVGSTAWRLAKEGRIRKLDRYSYGPREETPEQARSDASSPAPIGVDRPPAGHAA